MHSRALSPPAAMGDISPIPPVPPLPKEYQSSSSTANLDVQPLSPRRVATPPSPGDDDEDRTTPTIDSQTPVKRLRTQSSPKRPTKKLRFSSGNNTPREMGPITSPPQTSGPLPTIAESSAITRNSSQVLGSTATPDKSSSPSPSNIPSFPPLSPDIRNESPPPVSRRRTRSDNTVVRPPSGHVHIRIRSLGSMPSEMLQNMLIDVGKKIRDFTALNSNTRTVASKWSMHVGKIKTLPTSSQPLPRDSPVGKGPSQFPSAEDYAYFSLLSIINTHLYNQIFHPFHPAASDAENTKLETNYQRLVETGVCLCLGTDGHNYAQLYFVQLYRSKQLNGVRAVSSLSKLGSTTFRGQRCFATYPTPYSRPG